MLREEKFVAPGSAAVEHPQIFGVPGTKSPKRGFRAVSYAEFHARGEGDVPDQDSPAAGASNGHAPSAAEVDGVRADGEMSSDVRPEPDDLKERIFDDSVVKPLPDWVPEPLLREWVARPTVIDYFRSRLNQAPMQERRQLILTGLGRKGEIRPDSAPAAELARLCRRNLFWWCRCSRYAFIHYGEGGDGLRPDDLPRLYDDLDGLVETHEPELIVLACLRLGLFNDEVQVLADEAADALGGGGADQLDEELNKLQARLALAEEESREANDELRNERKARQSAERGREALKGELERSRASKVKAGDAAEELAATRERLAQALAEKATAEAERDSLLEESERARTLEQRLGDIDAELTAAQGELALAQDEVERRRRNEQELQDAMRTIGDLNVRIGELERQAETLPAPADARSLVHLLDSAIGALVAEASERIRAGTASGEDRQLLAFAAEFVEFKLGLPEQQPPAVGVETAEEVVFEPEVEAPTEAPEAPEEPVTQAAPEPTEAEGEPGTPPARRRRVPIGWSIRPVGGAGEIGASAIVATTPSGKSVLLDAGQRVRGVYGSATNDYDFHFGLAGVDELSAILISHAHIDHTGSLPVLHRNQSARQEAPIPVFMSEPTKALAEIMMRDSAKIQHWRERELREIGESDWGQEMLGNKPAYGNEEVDRVLEATASVDPYVAFEVPESGITVRFEPVAHVLGSCAIHLTDQESGSTLLYTGDLGPISHPQLTLPEFGGVEQLTTADVVVMESTYGKPRDLDAVPEGRRAPQTRREREIKRFYKLSEEAFARGGFVLLPCFSLGRAQELARLIYEAPNRDLARASIYIGGMAERILEIYTMFAERGERDRGIRWVNSGQFPRTTSLHRWLGPDKSHADVAAELLAGDEPGFIIASPAMLNGGWSLTFTNEMVDDPRHAVIFSGFLPRDDRTTVRLSDWRKGATYMLDGNRRPIQCEWDRVGLSAHAPAEDLRLFARRMAEKASAPVSFLLVHGLPEAERVLATDVAAFENVAEARAMMNNASWTQRR